MSLYSSSYSLTSLSSRWSKIFDEDEKTEEEEPRDYREHPDSDEDEDTSNDGTQDDDE
jgi:hypothetical protein